MIGRDISRDKMHSNLHDIAMIKEDQSLEEETFALLSPRIALFVRSMNQRVSRFALLNELTHPVV